MTEERVLTPEQILKQVREWEEIARNYEGVRGSLSGNLGESCRVIRALLEALGLPSKP